jgi:DNA-directed RNA polymerase specialized sigma subunit
VLSLELSRPPPVDELSRHLKIDPSNVLEALEAGRNRRPLSLEAPVRAEDGRLRFIDELPQSQVAARLGCSQMQVSRRLRQTLERLRRMGEGGGGMLAETIGRVGARKQRA